LSSLISIHITYLVPNAVNILQFLVILYVHIAVHKEAAAGDIKTKNNAIQ